MLYTKNLLKELLMNTSMRILFALVSSIILGCATRPSIIDQKLAENNKGAFTEYNGGPVPADKSILNIKATLKTHKDTDGSYWFEKKNCPHGKPAYRFLLNIDGQSIVWTIDGKMENLPEYHPDGKPNRDPDAGEGIKYILDKRIAVSPGKHRLFFSLVDESLCKELNIIIQKGHEHYFEMKPLYRNHSRLQKWPSFQGELQSVEVHFDGIHSVD